MLVLTRKTGQSIMIGDDIEVTLLEVDGAKVRLGIKAPHSVPVHRMEIYLAIHGTEGQKPDLEPPTELRALKRQAS